MEVLQCEANPGGYDCLACKGFKGIGICSHVVAVNHILTKYNVRDELKLLQTKAAKKSISGGNRKRPVPALERHSEPEPDSSDEEEERLLALGRHGK